MRRCSPIPPVVPPVSRFPRCAKPRKSVISVNGQLPDADGNVNAGDVRREDFSGVEPKEKMTLNEVGAKVNEVIGRLGVAADSAAASPRASGYGPGTPLGDVHPDTVLRDVVEAAGMSADDVRAIASEVVAPVAASVTDLKTSKLDRADVVDPAAATEDGKAADAKRTQEELDRISGVASDAKALAESKADKLSSRQLEAVNSGIDADKVAKIAQNEIAISEEVSRATTEEARLQALINAIKTFDAVVADSLPTPSEQYGKKLYLVPSTNPETRNVKDEFICVKTGDSWSWEQVGSTAITIEFDDEPTEGSQKAARSGGIWSWVKSLLPRWLTSDYAEPATVESVAKKADKTIPSKWGDLAALDEAGNLIDSSIDMQDVALKNQVNVMADMDSGFVNGHSSGFCFKLGDGEQRLAVLKGLVIVDRDGKDAGERGVAMLGDIYALSSSKADKSALTDHTENTNNPHAVTAEQAGAVPLVEDNDGNRTAVTIGSRKSSEPVGPNSLANGYGTTASSGYSHAEGNGTTASGSYSHAEGNITTASGSYSHAEGFDTTASGYSSHAEGFDTTASSGCSHAEGNGTTASGSYSHAEGYHTTASGNSSHASGTYSKTRESDGFAFAWNGDDTKSSGSPYNSHGPGTFNINPVGGPDGLFIGEQTLPQVINAAITGKADLASFAPQYSATSAYSVGSIVCHDGNIYQCKTAIADGGEAWNAEHWELRKLDDFFTNSNSLLTGTIDEEVISKGTAPDAHLEAPTDEHLKLVLADNSVAYDSAKALPYKLTSVIGDRVVATMTLTSASTDITLPTISANDTTVKDFILDVTNAYAVEGVATDAGINIPRTDFKLVTRDGESLTAVTTVKAGRSAFICFTQKSPVVVDGTTYPCWCVIQLPFGDPS